MICKDLEDIKKFRRFPIPHRKSSYHMFLCYCTHVTNLLIYNDFARIATTHHNYFPSHNLSWWTFRPPFSWPSCFLIQVNLYQRVSFFHQITQNKTRYVLGIYQNDRCWEHVFVPNPRAVARSENLGGLVVLGGKNVPPGWDRVNWSAKNWEGLSPPSPLLATALKSGIQIPAWADQTFLPLLLFIFKFSIEYCRLLL